MTPFSPADIERFLQTGWLRLDGAVPRALAGRCRAALWQHLGLSPHRPEDWTRPVVHVPYMASAPFVAAGNAPLVRAAFDQLCGPRGWRPLEALGGIPIRFPTGTDGGDTGWHVDLSLDYHLPDFWDWRVNVASEGRCLLALFLLSDVGEEDAPTILREGSHLDTARRLRDHGRRGLTARELNATGYAESAHRTERLAAGPAGTVFLLHPFIVHRAQVHRGTRVRFMAQQIVLPRRRDPDPESPVVRAIRSALERPPDPLARPDPLP